MIIHAEINLIFAIELFITCCMQIYYVFRSPVYNSISDFDVNRCVIKHDIHRCNIAWAASKSDNQWLLKSSLFVQRLQQKTCLQNNFLIIGVTSSCFTSNTTQNKCIYKCTGLILPIKTSVN